MKYILERTFAAQIGLRDEQIRALRQQHLQNSSDFKKEGRDIWLSEEGQKKLRGLLELDEKQGAGLSEDGGQRVGEAVVVEVELWCVGVVANPRVIHATAVEPKEWAGHQGRLPVLIVRVRSAVNFRARMRLRAIPTNRPGVFDLAGRCPRFPGRY